MADDEPTVLPKTSARGWLEGVTTLKIVLPVIFAIGSAAGGLITLGTRISDLAFRIGTATSLAGELKGRLDASLPVMTSRVEGLEYRVETGIKERAAIWQQIEQTRDALGTKLDELRKDREAATNKLTRIEAQLEDLKTLLADMESRAHRMSVAYAARVDGAGGPR